jgi:hypothetical protein
LVTCLAILLTIWIILHAGPRALIALLAIRIGLVTVVAWACPMMGATGVHVWIMRATGVRVRIMRATGVHVWIMGATGVHVWITI